MVDNKFYASVNLLEHKEVLSSNSLLYEGNHYEVPMPIVETICKNSGIPATLMNILKRNNPELLISNILSGCDYYYKGNLNFLIENDRVLSVSFNKNTPLLNKKFISIMESTLEDYSDIVSISSLSYDVNSLESSITIYPTEGFVYNNTSYNLGVVFENDELDTISCKLLSKLGDIEFYLPSKYFNLSASRYMRTSKDMEEALRQLIIRVLESIQDRDRWFSLILEVDICIRNCKKIKVTYEEYKNVIKLLNKISSDSDINEDEYEDIKNSLDSEFLNDFVSNYPAIDEKKNSYIWRCSALSELSIYDLVMFVNDWKNSKVFYPSCDKDIMRLIGDFIMLERVSMNLAVKK